MASFGHLLPPPPAERRGIPFYHEKTEDEFRSDVYERYDSLVMRQTALHLADVIHGNYPFADLLAYIERWLPASPRGLVVADIGCSVGRIAGELAGKHPGWDVYGIDLSYQMLRQARDHWMVGETLHPNLIRFGWETPALVGKSLPNVHFALANAGQLPFPDASLDVLINTFLIDRLPAVFPTFAEWARVLRPGGRLITVSPLNFLEPTGWREAYPPVKILERLRSTGWQLADWTDPFVLAEPLDARGNAVIWQCLAFAADR